MDTSEVYIKMCDYPEIQEGWGKRGVGGNFYAWMTEGHKGEVHVDMYPGGKYKKENKMIHTLIGWYLKRQRIKRGVTLREFCIRQEYDASTISRLERGYYFRVAPEFKRLKNRSE